jgi:hypothetical protein
MFPACLSSRLQVSSFGGPPNLVFTLFGDGAEKTPGVGALVSSSQTAVTPIWMGVTLPRSANTSVNTLITLHHTQPISVNTAHG